MNIDDLRREIQEAPDRTSYKVARAIGELTDQVFDLMRSQDVNNSTLANRLGKSRAWVGRLLSGDHNMTVKTAVMVIDALGHELEFAVKPKRPVYVDIDTSVLSWPTTAYNEEGNNEFRKAA